MEEVFTNKIAKKRTLVYVYYAGHGACDNDTCIILNERSAMYPLEKMLRAISRMKDCYVIALFDCCREKLS